MRNDCNKFRDGGEGRATFSAGVRVGGCRILPRYWFERCRKRPFGARGPRDLNSPVQWHRPHTIPSPTPCIYDTTDTCTTAFAYVRRVSTRCVPASFRGGSSVKRRGANFSALRRNSAAPPGAPCSQAHNKTQLATRDERVWRLLKLRGPLNKRGRRKSGVSLGSSEVIAAIRKRSRSSGASG